VEWAVTDDEFKSLDVMVVEDEALAMKIVSELLKIIGVRSVTTAGNGTEGLAKLAEAEQKNQLNQLRYRNAGDGRL
jgi:CheY-like chemotaxis protein